MTTTSNRPSNGQAALKAIETQYRGHRFRSRLEARWAVAFDMLKIQWEYEKEGYDLGSDGLYLPDFWLPQWRVHLEVKGDVPTADEERKCMALQVASGRAVMCVYGVINNFDGRIYCWDSSESGGGRSSWPFRFGVATGRGGDKPFYYIADIIGDGRTILACEWDEPISLAHQSTDFGGVALSYALETGSGLVQYALDYAASARFEHGERP